MSDWEDEYYDPEEYAVECKFCGEGPLYWEETEDGWRLFDEEGEMHRCLAMKPTAQDEFEPMKEETNGE